MTARFRIRTKDGQELSFASQEIFAEFVRSGDLSPDDVVYDSATREWSSARTHPVVLQIELEAEKAARGARGEASADGREEEDEASSAGADVSADGGSRAGGIQLDLAPAPAGLTPEQQAAAFVAKMEAERASERGFDDDGPIQGLRTEKGAPHVLEDLAPPAEKPEPRRRDWPEPSREPAPTPRRQPPTAVPAPPRRRRSSGSTRKYAPFAVLGFAAVLAGVYFGPGLFAPLAGDDELGGTVELPPPPGEIADTEGTIRARARERFLTSTQAALRGLDPIPQVWLRGSYLAAPSDYAQVPQVWEEYLTLVRQVRAEDEDRYRQAYLRALDDAGVAEGGARTLRLSGAIADFRAASESRTAHYDRVEALATVALQGHAALVAAEGTILYQPASGPSLSGDPVIEAVGRSPEAQALLNRVLDMILAELHAAQGPGESADVREWVGDGLLEAVTS